MRAAAVCVNLVGYKYNAPIVFNLQCYACRVECGVTQGAQESTYIPSMIYYVYM